MKIHEEGRSFIAICLACVLVSFFISPFAVIFFSLLAIAVATFFRDPDRVPPLADNVILSPADGSVSNIENAMTLPKEIAGNIEELKDSQFTRVSIFLSVFDVHVNRNAASGVVVDTYYNAGKFFNASLDKASEFNERQLILVRTDEGQYVCFVQIAGLIARRIVCNLDRNAIVKAGERFGIIRFGSRMDVYVPSEYALNVRLGQIMVGGETVIATRK
ncbi:Phosphatidylserine decarboxylase proenzyme [Candidatus Fokinia solitaria]|uniref:Phosphatidylserine decarboxylase proenzyme n=2 Tax=Candidatus Fokinia solitaria TaxID=1802984 RepID=A0A2U8BRZ9_9RICK|nr:Phosphatidylserine decarboxylase proenzyme [Candidatus Fokinia solitaria]